MTQIVTTPVQFSEWAKKKKLSLIPEISGFKVGDKVTFTNEYGVSFYNLNIIGIDSDNSFYGRQIYLNTDSYWFPHTPNELTMQK